MGAAVGRGRVPLVLLLAVLAALGARWPAAARGHTDHGATVSLGWLAPDTPATQHDLRDWTRLPSAARHVVAAPLPDGWWAVATAPVGGWTPTGGLVDGHPAGTGVAGRAATTPSTRAPPARVS